jgi:hypothetical protein
LKVYRANRWRAQRFNLASGINFRLNYQVRGRLGRVHPLNISILLNKDVSKSKKLEIYWYTITYRQILLWGLLLAALLSLAALPFIKEPVKQFLANQAKKILETDLTQNSAGMNKSGGFAIIKGVVKVKKASANQWNSADYQTKLETGDYIQTSSDGIARIQFPDGTTYDMKPDSLLVVQENSEDPKNNAKKVSVRVTSGSVDLTTTKREVSSSRSEVTAASAVAVLNQDTRMAVETNPVNRTSQFMVSRGQAMVRHQNGAETEVNPYESVTATEKQLVKEKVLSPPELTAPESFRPLVFKPGAPVRVSFSWKPVPKAAAYKIRISNSQIFSKIFREETVHGKTEYTASGFNEGTYYWAVNSIDENKQISRENDPPGKFTIIFQSPNEKDTSNIFLTIDRVYRMGSFYQVIGRTTPGNTILINDESVLTETNGTFKQITSPVPHRGKFVISITAQDRNGNSKTIPYFVDLD